MNEWIVFNGDDMPDRMLNVQYTVSNAVRYHDIGHTLHNAKQQLAMNIAQKIVEGEPFFHVREIKSEGMTEISACCVVVTAEEWRKAMQDQFKRGRDCGMGMMPPTIKGD